MPNGLIKTLLIEDNPGDVRLIQEALSEGNGATPFDLSIVDRLSSGMDRLAKNETDVLLLDLSLPDSQGFDTFVRIRSEASHLPIIVLTGLDDETLALKAVREGAQDYLVKGQVDSLTLVRAIRYAIERKRLETEKEKLILQLKETLTKVKTLSGMLPICSSCKKIRNDEGYWTQVEVYIRDHSEAEFTHGICPECFKKLYPDFEESERG